MMVGPGGQRCRWIVYGLSAIVGILILVLIALWASHDCDAQRLQMNEGHECPLNRPSTHVLIDKAAHDALDELIVLQRDENEYAVVALLLRYALAQRAFHARDRYGVGTQLYANPKHGSGIADLFQHHGVVDAFDSTALVEADYDSGPHPKILHGYFFRSIVRDRGSALDSRVRCGLSAAPAHYMRSGRHMIVVDERGRVYATDAGNFVNNTVEVEPPREWPDVDARGWFRVH